MGLRESIEALPEEDYHSWCQDNLPLLFEAIVDNDMSLLAGVSPVSPPPLKQTSIPFSCRAYLKKQSTTGMDYRDGLFDPFWSVTYNLSSLDRRLPGIVVADPCKLKRLTIWCNNNSSSSNHKWKLHVVKQAKVDDSSTAVSTVLYSDQVDRDYRDTNNHLIEVNLDESLERNDTLSLLFSRDGNSGSSTYYTYCTGMFLLEGI